MSLARSLDTLWKCSLATLGAVISYHSTMHHCHQVFVSVRVLLSHSPNIKGLDEVLP